MNDADALLLLTLTPGLGPTLTRRCLEYFGSATATVSASTAQLAGVQGIGQGRAAAIRDAMTTAQRQDAVQHERGTMAKAGAVAVAVDDPAYPKLLRLIPDPPPLLFVRGQLAESDAVSLGVVGARKCTQYGREQADRLSGLAADAGLTIISGGAYGIDAAAHRAALRHGGRTIAVLGSGLARPYPADHAELFDQIAAGHGAVVSELPMTAPPIAENFPRRNRIISGLSLGILVVEAALRSGALITARLAAEEHGREVMALPGRVDSPVSMGCHKLLRNGQAALVTNLADILDSLGEAGSSLRAGIDVALESSSRDKPTTAQASLFEANITEPQRKLLDALTEPRSLDELITLTALPAGPLQADLTLLQIRNLVARRDGRYQRAR